MPSLDMLRSGARAIFDAALMAANPRLAVHRALMRRGDQLLLKGAPIFDLTHGRVVAVGAGKAGAPMAQAVEEIADVNAGAVTVKYEHVAPTKTIRLNEAGHPLPDENTLRATQSLVSLLKDVTEQDLVVCLFSGGGSALMEWLVEGVTLDDLRVFTNALLRCGATIYEINTLRKHISRVKGGQFARLAQPARVVSLILSDVLGSPLDVIASGPTAPDSSTFADCAAIIKKYELREILPPAILEHYERGARGAVDDTPKENDLLFARVTNVIIADNQIACDAAAEQARARGYTVNLLSTTMQGEAREIGSELGRMARETRNEEGGARNEARETTSEVREARDEERETKSAKRETICWLGGGEPTVRLRGQGKGGRAQELVLAAALEIAGDEKIVVLSAGTDGTDGPTDAAGAIADNTTPERAQRIGLDARTFLENNDAYHFFSALDDLVITGPTNTNVNDLMIVLRA